MWDMGLSKKILKMKNIVKPLKVLNGRDAMKVCKKGF